MLTWNDTMVQLPRHLFGTLVGLVFFISGVYMTYHQAAAMWLWEDASAKVLHSGLEELSHRDYKPDIIYEYEADGKPYRGVCCGQPYSSKDNAEEFISNYPEGEIVQIRIDPGNPAASRLPEDLNPSYFFFYGIFTGIGGIFAAAFGYNMLKELKGGSTNG